VLHKDILLVAWQSVLSLHLLNLVVVLPLTYHYSDEVGLDDFAYDFREDSNKKIINAIKKILPFLSLFLFLSVSI